METGVQRFRWKPSWTGFAVAAAVGATLLAAASRSGSAPSAPFVVPAFMLVTGICGVVFHARRWFGLLGGLLFGLAAGMYSALSLDTQVIGGVYALAAPTLGIFVVLGTFVGVIVEFVRVIHEALHRATTRDG